MSSVADLEKKTHPSPWTTLHTTINISSNPSLPHTCNSDQWRRGVPGLPEAEKEKKNQAQTVSLQLVWNPVLTSFPPSSQRSSTDHWSQLCEVPSCFKCSTIIPIPKKPKTYHTKWLQACGSNVCGHEVIWKTGAGPPEGHHWTLAGSSSICLQSKQVCGRSSQHGTALCSATSRQTRAYVRILFVDFSSVIPNLLLPKLTQVSMPTSICQWINRVWSALELLKAVFSAHCSSPCTWTTHIKRPLCQATKVFRRHHTDRPHPGWWWVCLQTGG